MHKSKSVIIEASKSISPEVFIPGDKSITHRAVMFSCLSNAQSVISTSALGRDNFSTIRILRQLGIEVSLKLSSSMMKIAETEGLIEIAESSGTKDNIITINGLGVNNLKKPAAHLYCGNSGTTARLICGILAHTDFSSTLTGDSSLSKRPFDRISNPLSEMGVGFSYSLNDGALNNSSSSPDSLNFGLPLQVRGVRMGAPNGRVKAKDFVLKKPSAQVKSAILLSGLHADGLTRVTEPLSSRDHTELMLKAMGAKIKCVSTASGEYQVEIEGVPFGSLAPLNLPSSVFSVPGDFSSAMFFIVAGLIGKNSQTLIKNVGVNPSRTGAFDILKRMGADIQILAKELQGGEQVADILVKKSELKGTYIGAEDVARAIDEIPIICVLSAFSEGVTEIRGAGELRLKESDRISMMKEVLASFGVSVVEHEDGLSITGNCRDNALKKYHNDSSAEGAKWKSSGDHRIYMSAAIMQFSLGIDAVVYDFEAVETSFPTFIDCFQL